MKQIWVPKDPACASQPAEDSTSIEQPSNCAPHVRIIVEEGILAKDKSFVILGQPGMDQIDRDLTSSKYLKHH